MAPDRGVCRRERSGREDARRITRGRDRAGVSAPRRTRLLRVAVVAAMCCGVVATAVAQETGGTIAGTVSDPQGAVLPGVTITLRNDATNAVLSTTTNAQGAYVLPFVPIGGTR